MFATSRSSRWSIVGCLALVTLATACTGDVEDARRGDGRDAAAGSDGGGLDVTCEPGATVRFEELWNTYFAPSAPTGCAAEGCHGTGAGKLQFSTMHQMWKATVSVKATSGGGLARIEPGMPGRSFLYQKLLASAGEQRMPLGGPYLDDDALAKVARYICQGAPEPGSVNAADGGAADAASTDGGADGGPSMPGGPVIDSFTPSSGVVGTAVTIVGAGFSATAGDNLVSFNGTAAVVGSASPNMLVASVPAGASTGPITVVVDGMTAQSSEDFAVVVPSPAPVLTSIAPSSALAGAANLTVTLTGSGFQPFSVVVLGDKMLTTTYQSAAKLQAVVPAARLAAAGTLSLAVVTRGPGGGTSASKPLQVNNPAPVITALAPSSVAVGAATFSLQVDGTGFVQASTVKLSGAATTTTFVSKTRLTAQVAASLLDTAGALQVTVENPAPGGGSSAAAALSIQNPAPQLDSLDPSSTDVGSADTDITLLGSNFMANSVVKLGTLVIPSSFVDGGHITATLDAANLVDAGTLSLSVETPAPGGGASAAKTFTVTHAVPSIGAISPSDVAVGGAPLLLTVDGTGFDSSTSVELDGSPVTTTYVSATRVRGAIPTFASAGNHTITVTNPTPGGGTSTGLTLSATASTLPQITGLAPESHLENEGFPLTLTGANFMCGGASQVFFDGAMVNVTDCTAATTLVVDIPATAAGTYSVQVKNGADESNLAQYTITVANPKPVTTSFEPTVAAVGSAAFTLTVHGSGFVPGAVVRWDGVSKSTTFIDASTLTAVIAATDIDQVGSFAISVFNPAPGGGASDALADEFLVVQPAPMPSISSLSPSTVLSASGAQSLTVFGTGFTADSVVTFDAAERTTHFDAGMPDRLVVDLPAGDVAVSGTHDIAVKNPTLGGGGGTSAGFTLSVVDPNPVPSISGLSPSSKTVGSATFTLTVNGSGFIASSGVTWGGVAKTTTFVSSAQLTVSVSSSDLTTAGSVTVAVINPAPGGGSDQTTFDVQNPTPSITSILPTNITAGTGATSLTVNGSGFVSSSVVRVDGASRTTHFVNASQLTADLLAGDTASVATPAITVENPAPGGGTSGSATLTIDPVPSPVPTLASLSPCGKVAGSSTFTLTLTGTKFVDGATVTFNGTTVSATFVSATQLTASISSALIASAPADNAIDVAVVNPAPGGGSSGTVTFGLATQTATLSAQVQPIFTASCATSMCHSASGTAPMDLSTGNAYASMVNVASGATGCNSRLVVDVCKPLRSQSVLVDKVKAGAVGAPAPCAGSKMPKGASLTAAEIQKIVDWVAQGAPM